MGRKSLLFFLFLFVCFRSVAAGDPKSIVKGKIYNKSSHTPVYDVHISIPALHAATASDGEGEFALSEVPYGSYTVVFSGAGIIPDTVSVSVSGDVTDMGEILVMQTDKVQPSDNTEIPTITVDDVNTNQDDDGSSTQGSNAMFIAGQDVFMQAATYSFGQYFFKPRGTSSYVLQLNGINIEDLERGFSTWSHLGSLNDVMHGRSVTYGLQPSPYDYGGPNGTTYIDATAADQRKGNTVTYTRYNRNYNNRVMFTHNSGLMKNNWAWSVSGSRRWAEEGNTPGTFYDGYSFYAAVSKVIGKGQLNLTAIAAPTRRGRALNTFEEAYRITGDNQYNPAWGYQNGEKRNSRVVESFQPIAILNYTLRPNDRTRWNTAFGFETGQYKSSTIDFYNAYSPRPDYYRNLPSYYTSRVPSQPDVAAAVEAELTANPARLQVDWDALYNANYKNIETIKNVGGIAGNDITGRRSLYVLSNYVDELKKYSFNSNIEHSHNEHLTFMGGVTAVSQQNTNYRQVEDLLGGDFFLNTYQFLSNENAGNQAYAQNDLNNPNQIVRKGDKYGYHYVLRNNQAEAWGQGVFVFNKVDLFASLSAGYTSFTREGKMRNGLFPEHSYGKSDAHGFFTHKSKGGVTYKVDLHNALYVNADYTTEAPLMSNTFISVGTRDYTIDNPTTVKTGTVEAGYLLHSNHITARVTGYVSETKDNTLIKRFFYDDLATQAFVSYVMNKVSTRSTGIEFSAAYKINGTWRITGMAAVGQYFYTSNPMVNIYLDNDPTVSTKAHRVYIENFYMGAGPQSVYTMGLNYRPGRWNMNLNFNYQERNYINIYPERRTPVAVALIEQDSKLWNAITDQERLPGAFTTDLYISRSFSTRYLSAKLHRNTSLFVSLGITNLLNKKDIRMNGYEQLRYDFTNRLPDKFQNYYDYAFGRTFAANISFRF